MQLCSDVSGICRDQVVAGLPCTRQATWLHTCNNKRAALLRTMSRAVRATSSENHVLGVVWHNVHLYAGLFAMRSEREIKTNIFIS